MEDLEGWVVEWVVDLAEGECSLDLTLRCVWFHVLLVFLLV